MIQPELTATRQPAKPGREIQIYFDGGCRPTNPGNKYGSFEVVTDGQSMQKRTFELGRGTNNEAEFEALIQGLQWTAGSGLLTPEARLVVFTDSTIVANRINGRNRTNRSEPQRRMAALAAKCFAYGRYCRGIVAHWRGREDNVARFGH